MTEPERVILNDCCEDWIVDWGGFYEQGRAFNCPECTTGWTKIDADRFERRGGDSFERRVRRGPDVPSHGASRAEFPYLAATSGSQPIVERCCAKILLRHGERLAEGSFRCPVCGTGWERRTERLHGLRVPVFAKDGLAEPLTIQPGRTRPFLVALSEYSPPRD